MVKEYGMCEMTSASNHFFNLISFQNYHFNMGFFFDGQPCNNPSCLYLHNMGAEEDSFGKDEAAAVHTRYYMLMFNFVFALYCLYWHLLYVY